MTYVVALDQGTTSSRTVLIDGAARMAAVSQDPFPQIFPEPGWVEHDPFAILSSQLGTFANVVADQGLTAADLAGIGITNQRETTMVWDRATGEPVFNAIVWQCRRTADLVGEICGDPAVAAEVTARTGLIPDAYFSASKIAWILRNVPGAAERAQAGELAFGTVDTWLIWNLTGGAVHATDFTNASRTMLFNIHTGEWDPYLLDLFGIPASVLPEVRPSSGAFGCIADAGTAESLAIAPRAAELLAKLAPVAGTPICGVAGDQQAALFGQCCFEPGESKNTYGTGCFLLMHTGHEACKSTNGLVTTIAASGPDVQGIEYALEGSVFMAGALIQWLRDELGIIKTAAETEGLALSVPDTAGVHVVPAFTGLGAPYWDSQARGAILGLTRGAGRAHIVRAALESLAFQVSDLVKAMEADAGAPMTVLNVDGGACANGFLMQFQADILDTQIRRPANAETTALGAAFLAGLSAGFWKSTADLSALRASDDVFEPAMDAQVREEQLAGWKEAVSRVRTAE